MESKLPDAATLVGRALAAHTAVPAFNIPYLPMMPPVVRALQDARAFGFIMVARLEWEKFEARSPAAIRDAYRACRDTAHTRLHLDHVPVVDEDQKAVDYRAVIGEALELGYDSVMVDGSRLPLSENIAATRWVVERAHASGRPVEAELGAVLGHEAGPLPPYEELFKSGRGFTDPAEARRFCLETGVDWLSVAIGNIHGAISASARQGAKFSARLDLKRLEELRDACGVPLVLHGGTGIARDSMAAAIRLGIAKVNVATAIRQPYERALPQGQAAAEEAVYRATLSVLKEELQVEGSAALFRADQAA